MRSKNPEEDVIEIIDGKKYLRLYYFMPAEHFLEVLEKDEIKVSIPEECNDPLEFLPAVDKQNKTPKRLEGGFISFSRRYNSSLMWAHYADSHKGVCLEFLFPIKNQGNLKEKRKSATKKSSRYVIINVDMSERGQYTYLDLEHFYPVAVEVAYRKHRPEHDLISRAVFGPQGLISLDISVVFYTKSIEWKYEKEWRLLVCLSTTKQYHDGAFFVTGLTKYLHGIIIGAKYNKSCGTAWSHIYQSLMRNPHFNDSSKIGKIKLSRAAYDDNKYEIVLE